MTVHEDDPSRLTEENPVPLVAAQPYSRPHVLQQTGGPASPQQILLTADTIVIGRSPDADIRIQSSALSRLHVRLERYCGGYRAIDLDSSNGLFLNEIRIHSAALRDGDTLQLGNAVFIYYEGG